MNSSSSSINALKLLQERFAPGHPQDILMNDESGNRRHEDSARRSGNRPSKEKRPGRPKGSVNKKKSGGKYNKINSKHDSSDNEEDPCDGNDDEDRKDHRNKSPKCQVAPSSTNNRRPFDCQGCRFRTVSHEQYMEHLINSPCGAQPKFNNNSHRPMPSNGRKKGPSNIHPQMSDRSPAPHHPPQYYPTPFNNVPPTMYPHHPHPHQFPPNHRMYFQPHIPPNDYRSYDNSRDWSMRYPWPINEYPPFYPPVYPPPHYRYGHPKPQIEGGQYFCKQSMDCSSSSNRCKINGFINQVESSGLEPRRSKEEQQRSLDPDLEVAIDSIRNEDDEGENRLVEEVVALVDAKNESEKKHGGIMEMHNLPALKEIFEVKSNTGMLDDGSFLKECSRDPVLGATAGFVIPEAVVSGSKTNGGDFEVIVNEESLLPQGSLTSDSATETIFEDENLRLIVENNFETQLCPHKSVLQLQPVPISEQARDSLKLTTIQAQLDYVLTGLLGNKWLSQKYDYPRVSIINVLHKVLFHCNIKAVEENYLCGPECDSLSGSLNKNELTLRVMKLRLHVIRANIGKLLCACTPHRNEWKRFGWDGLTIDEILEDLTREEIPSDHLFFEEEAEKAMKEQETVYLMEIAADPETLGSLKSGGEIEISNRDS